MLVRRAPLLALGLLFAPHAVAQADPTDEFVRAEMQRQRIPGLSLVVLRDGEIVKAAGYGVVDRDLEIPATPETVYKIASVSKQFIASGVMVLVQDGHVDLDALIRQYLRGAPAAWDDITVRHLLTHTSGLVREAPGFDPYEVQSDLAVIETAYQLPLEFAAGERWAYSNLGYFVLAEVIRTVSGRPWSEFLGERLFGPAGMTATRTTDEVVPNLATGYSDNDRLLEADYWPAVRPSGAFLSTVLDLAKWDAVLYTDRVLDESSRRQMWTPVTLNDGSTYPYGFGWQLGEDPDRTIVHHAGGMPGFRADFARFVDDGLTVILLANLDDMDPWAVLWGVVAIHRQGRE